MKQWMWRVAGFAALVVTLGSSGCITRAPKTAPQEDLTPFQQLIDSWTREYTFRRSVGGDDLVSEQAAIIERPSHEEKLIMRATLFADTLVKSEIKEICQEDTTGVSCDSIAHRYEARHNWPGQFRVEVNMLATLAEPFTLESLTMYLTDGNGIDYEARRRVFSEPVTEQHSYLDREVLRYDPYTSQEYRVYQYRHGYEYRSAGAVTLYFDRVNAVGEDLLAKPGQRLMLKFRRDHSSLGEIRWDLDGVRRQTARRSRS